VNVRCINYSYIVILILCISSLSSAENITFSAGDQHDPDWKNTRLNTCSLIKENDGTHCIMPNYYHFRTNSKTELYFSFNQGWNTIKNDDSGNYRISSSKYTTDNHAAFRGSPTGGFIYYNDRVSMAVPEGSWLDNDVDCGSFTIEMWLRPNRLREGDIIFRRSGSAGGVVHGIELRIEQGYLTWYFHNFFYTPLPDTAGSSLSQVSSFTLRSSQPIPVREWHHYAVTFNRINGRLTAWCDGNEDAIVWATENRTGTGSGATVLVPHFYEHEGTQAYIGFNYLGFLEDFCISRYAKQTFPIFSYTDEQVMAIGPVFDTGSTGSILNDYTVHALTPGSSQIVVFIRASDTKFSADDPYPIWHTLNTASPQSGRYQQWRAQLITSPDGKYAASLQDISFAFTVHHPPQPPIGVKAAAVLSAGAAHITVSWNRNTEDDLAGYKIYYGTRSGYYPSVIDAGAVTEYTINVPERGHTYYCVITAYDTDVPMHESAYSREVTVTIQ